MSEELRVWSALFWGIGIGEDSPGPRLICYAIGVTLVIAAFLVRRQSKKRKGEGRNYTLAPGELLRAEVGKDVLISRDNGQT